MATLTSPRSHTLTGLPNMSGAEVGDVMQRTLPEMQKQQLTNLLGWFSLGIGAIELLAPRELARTIGVRHSEVLPWFGLREIVTGIGILSQRRPAGWMWGRVAGDFMDLSFLAMEHLSGRASPGRTALAAAAVAGVTVLDILCAERLSAHPQAKTSQTVPYDGSIQVHKAITVNRPAVDLYTMWRRFENLPQFMTHLKSVTTTDDRHSHWEAHAPAGATVEWDAEIMDDEPNRLISWRSINSPTVQNSGQVRFVPAPGDRGTQVFVDLHYRPIGGILGASLAYLFGESPEFQVQEDLRKFKMFMETGEVLTTEGQSTGRGRTPVSGL